MEELKKPLFGSVQPIVQKMQQELLKQQTDPESLENTVENKHLIERLQVPGTLFNHIVTEGNHFLTIKNYRVSPKFQSAEELDNYMNSCQWELIIRVCTVMYEICKETEEDLQQLRNEQSFEKQNQMQ